MTTSPAARAASASAPPADASGRPSWLARRVRFEDDRMVIVLRDGRELPVPLAEFPRLASATSAQRKRWRLIAHGRGIHWPEVDEDISVAILLGEAD